MCNTARKKLGLVKDMRKCRVDLKEGVTEVDEDKLTAAVAKARELNLNAPAEIKAAQDMLSRIAKEKTVLAALTKAINVGGWKKEGVSE